MGRSEEQRAMPAGDGDPGRTHTWGVLADDARRIVAAWEGAATFAGGNRRAEQIVAGQAAAVIGAILPTDLGSLSTGGLTPGAAARALEALRDPASEPPAPAARQASGRRRRGQEHLRARHPVPAAPPDDDLVPLSVLIDAVHEARLRNPRTLRPWGRAAIYKGVPKELARRADGEPPDRTGLYGVMADAFDAGTGRYRRLRFAAGLKALAERRLRADGVLADARALAGVESKWNAERATGSRSRRH